MSRLNQKHFMAGTFADDAVAPAINPCFFGVQPSAAFFERFGVSGCSLVVTGRGPTPVQHVVGYGDLMVSRSVGYAETVGILKSHVHPRANDAPESVVLNNGVFNDVIPQGDVIVGSRVELRLPLAQRRQPRTRTVSFHMGSSGRPFAEKDAPPARLYVPVFKEKTAIQVQGLYVVFPGLDDLAADFSHPSRPRSLN